MFTNKPRFMREADATTIGTGGTTTTSSLFTQLCADNKKTLANQNQTVLETNIKMRFINAVNTSNGNISSLTYEINTERAKLEGMNLNHILKLKEDVKAEQRAIAGAQEEYLVLFGTTMPTQIL